MVTHRRRCLNYSKAYSVATERLLLAWSQNKHITYYKHIRLYKLRDFSYSNIETTCIADSTLRL